MKVEITESFVGARLTVENDARRTGFGAPYATQLPVNSTPAGDAARIPEDDEPVHHAGPHPLATPTTEQGVALAALESGRWRIESGTFSVHDGPGPSDPLVLLRELRVSDWITADGKLTLTGRKAIARWLEQA